MDADRKEQEPKGGAAMTFREIAAVLGMTRGGAWMTYQSAMKKLRKGRRLAAFKVMLELHRMKG
jgi:alkylated DNA nucleotide flippase Atl1